MSSALNSLTRYTLGAAEEANWALYRWPLSAPIKSARDDQNRRLPRTQRKRRTLVEEANAWLAARSVDDTVERPTTLAPLYAISKGLAPGDAMIEAGLAG